MSHSESFSQYRNNELLTSDEESDDEVVEGSPIRNLSESKFESSVSQSFDSQISEEGASEEEIPETNSEAENNDDDDMVFVKKKKGKVAKIESSEEEEEEEKAIYSPRTRRSIHGFRKSASSDDESSEFSEDDSNEFTETSKPETSKETTNDNTAGHSLESHEITKFSKIYESKNTIDHSMDDNKNENVSTHFDSSIANKMSSTISGFEEQNETDKMKSIELVEDDRDIIEINSSDESKTSTPTLQTDVRERKLVQPKIFGKLNSTPVSSHTKPANVQPQFVSKEFLSRELRKLDDLRTELTTCQNLLKLKVNLPDNGARMRERIEKFKIQIKKHANYVSTLVVDEQEVKALRGAGIDQNASDPSQNVSRDSQKSFKAPTWDELAAAVDAIKPKHTGTQGIATFTAQKAMTVDRLKDIHGSLETCPDENILAENPKGMKIELMNHQKHALAWMLWREKQKPRGGILADDMGLGKTLTMISLIVKQNEGNDSKTDESSSDSEDNPQGWLSKGRKDYHNGGTLIVCPASLLQQWESEIVKGCQRNYMEVVLHHGNNRDTKPRHLAKNDVVITTYHIVSREFKTEGSLFRIKWDRIILDEAHVIRNHKAQMSISVCGLKAKYRWALTGTPVQNKEMDLYAIIKFLRCTPFDDFGHWKKWIDNKSAGGQARLNTLMKSLLLRRTKAQLQQNDENFKLPEKSIKLIEVILEKEEMNVYQRVMAFSQTLFAQFLHQRTEKENAFHFGNENNAPAFMQVKDPNGAFYKMHKKMSKMIGHNKEVKSFEILVLLLRLRQICCHPGLIDAMLEDDDLNQTESADESREVDLLRHLEKLQIEDNTEHSGSGSAESFDSSRETSISKGAARVLRKSNPVFDKSRPSSKLNKILEVLEENLSNNTDKAIVVSQWTSLLELLKMHLANKGYRTVSLNGSVAVKNRNELVTTFNDQKSKVRIMLLSLTAGGVGLNLVGANHLLLIDLHWNPQLESQAQDRIYRVGQKKPVFIYKFMVKDTVEERIKNLQDKKLEIANGVLTGAKSQGSKLTMEDLRGLFGL